MSHSESQLLKPNLTPLASVIIPCFNAESWILETLESLAAQTYSQVEIIVVDDGSIDHSLELARAFFQANPIGLVLENPGKGAQSARNLGLERCNGDYVKFMDADDIISRDLIANQVEALIQNPGGVAKCSWNHFSVYPPSSTRHIQSCDDSFDRASDFLVTLWNEGMYPVHAWLVPRELLKSDLRWNENVLQNQDGEFFARVCARSCGIHHTPGLAHYRLPAKCNLSQKRGMSSILSHTKVLDSYREVCRELGDDLDLLTAYNRQVFQVAYRAASHTSERKALSTILERLEAKAPLKATFPSMLMQMVHRYLGIYASLKIRGFFKILM